MLHLRVTCPSERTDDLVRTLNQAAGTVSVVVLRGAVVTAGGRDGEQGTGEVAADLVEADVVREAADHVLVLLERSGVREVGTVTVVELGLATGAAVDAAQVRAPGQGVDAVVWSQLVARTREDSALSSTYLVFLLAATLIAAVGLLTDSQVLIVGAMVLGPEFNVLASLAISLVDRDGRGAAAALRSLVVGFAAAAATAAVVVSALHVAGLVPDAYLQGRRPLTGFITDPGVFAVVVALLAGVAGTVSLTASKSSTLVGVFISVTTVPALAEGATAAVTGQGAKAVAAVEVLGLNLAAITVAAVLTLLTQRALWARLQGRSGEADPTVTSEEPWQRLRRTRRAARRRAAARSWTGPRTDGAQAGTAPGKG